jgi:hypothetical protein
LLRCPDHRQDGRHSDSADHEKHIVLVAAEIERVARTFEHQRVADVESIVHLDRAAAAVGDPTYCDPIVGPPPGRPAQ